MVTVDRRDIRDVKLERGDDSSAACSRDALEVMRNTQPFRQGNPGALNRTENYPPQLTLEASIDPDKEGWRRANPFDKHYDPNANGASIDYGPAPYRTNPPNRVDVNTDPSGRNPGYGPGDLYRPFPTDRSAAQNFPNPNAGELYRRPIDQSGDPYRRNPNDGYADNPYRRNPNDGPVDPYRRNPNDGYADNPYRRNPSDQTTNRNDAQPFNGSDRSGNVCRDANDRKNFYAAQNDAYSCSAFSMAMMASDWNTGRPPSNAESSHWKQIAGTIGQGYRGSLNQVAANLREGIPDLHTKVYNYGMGKVGTQAMQDLNRELAQGHTAVAKVINPHTGNAHYIYIAGRSNDGGYVLGDPDRKNPHQQPISGARLMSMMSRRDGFVAGWKDSPSQATRAQGSAANRFAMAHSNGMDNFATV